jgi:integrase
MPKSLPAATSVRPAGATVGAAGGNGTHYTLALNEANIRSAIPGVVLRDETIPGLHLRAFAERKSFYLWYRTKAGVERRPKLADHGVITLTQARATAKKMLASVALGGDPAAVVESQRNEPTLTELWDEFWKRYATHRKTSYDYKLRWDRKIEPKFGAAKLSAITYSNVCDFHEAITKNNGPVEANRTLAQLSKMFSFAHRPLQWFEGNNPCRGVGLNKEHKRRRKASREEIVRIVTRLRRELDGPNVASAAFILLLVLSGARKGEIAHTKWSNIDGNRILLDEHKTDEGGYARIIYLPPPALELIEKYLPRTKRGTITGIENPRKFWLRICEEENLPDLHLHDLRRTFASIALSTGRVTLEQVMQMLGHTNAQTTKVYAWLMEDAATEAVNLVASQIEPKGQIAAEMADLSSPIKTRLIN